MNFQNKILCSRRRNDGEDAESTVDYLDLSDDETMDNDPLKKKSNLISCFSFGVIQFFIGKSDFDPSENFHSVSVVDSTKLNNLSAETSTTTTELKSHIAVDEFELFGKLIAEKLRKLPSSRVNEVEINILQMMRNEELYSHIILCSLLY